MADNVTPRIRVPDSAAPGETITVKTLISHPMESGQRTEEDGTPIPRSILNRFTVTFNGEAVLDMTMEPAISTNPYVEFQARVPESGTFVFTWHDDDGSIYTARRDIAVG